MRKLLFLLIAISFSFSVKAQLDAKEKNAAMAAVRVNQKSLGLDNGDLYNMEVVNSYVDQQSGIRYVYLIQTYKNIPVYNQIQVLSFKGDKLLSKAGGRIPLMEEKMKGKSALPKLSASSAVLAALTDRKITGAKTPVAKKSTDNNRKIEFDNLGISWQNITTKLMWVPEKNGQIIHLAWQVFVAPNTSPDAWLVSVDAENSSIVDVHNFTNYDHWEKPADDKLMEPKAAAKTSLSNKNNLSAILKVPKNITINQQLKLSSVDGASYRVIPFPAESPIAAGGTPALVTNPWSMAPGNATTLKWHTGAGGIDYNYTRGNNVWAYQDRENNDIGTVNKSASSTTGSAPFNFNFAPDFTVDPTQTSPVQNQQFAITNLFYWNNIMHDVMYQYGFIEGAANFQDDNLQRGGVGNDHVNAEAQDGYSLNNANFYTPPDGYSGRMQMFLFDTRPVLHVNTPALLAGNYQVNSVSPYILLANLGSLTGDVALYEDGGTNQACSAATNNLTGKIALINIAGSCVIENKVLNAQNAGAIGVIIINDQPNIDFPPRAPSLTLPTVIISSIDGELIVNNLAQGVNITLSAAPAPYIDGDVDNSVIVHEYGHGISNRLTGGGIASCLGNAEQMGEGWSDYYALMFTQDWANSNLNSGFTNPRSIGAYVESTSNGVRSHKYSTDFSVNPLIYLFNLPYEPHDRGEIWCAALWEMTWAIIQQEGIINSNIYQPAAGGGNTIAMKLVTEGMKLQPCKPGFIDGRDAIIQADKNLYGGIHVCAIREAFSKRGMGLGASQGSSLSVTDQTPSFAQGPCIKATVNLTDFTTCAGTASQEQTFNVEGKNLTDNLVITAPGGFEVSNVSGTSFNSSVILIPTNGVVSATTIYIRVTALATTNSSGDVVFASTDADIITIRVNGIVNSLVVPSFHLVNAICYGSKAPLLPLVSDNGIQGSWNPSVISNTTSGTYTFTPNAGTGTCVQTFQATITVNPAPSVSFSGLPASICVNAAAITLTGSPEGGSFYIGDLSISNNFTSISNPFNPAMAGTGIKTIAYLLRGENGCYGDSHQNITVNALPMVSFSGLPTSVCVDAATITLTGTPTGGSFSGSGIIGNIFNPSAAGTGSKTIIYSYTNANGCSNSSSRKVTVNALPLVSFSGLPASVCVNGGAITLTGSPTGGTFSASGVSGNSFNPATAGTGTINIT